MDELAVIKHLQNGLVGVCDVEEFTELQQLSENVVKLGIGDKLSRILDLLPELSPVQAGAEQPHL